jgi:SulP family sulfate permease
MTAGAEEGEVIMVGPIMNRLRRSHFLEELTGKVHLSQFEAVSSINPELARRTLEAQRL